MTKNKPNTEIMLFEAKDGPEGIEVFVDDERGIVDWSSAYPAVYVRIANNGAYCEMGPFQLHTIYKQLYAQLKHPSELLPQPEPDTVEKEESANVSDLF